VKISPSTTGSTMPLSGNRDFVLALDGPGAVGGDRLAGRRRAATSLGGSIRAAPSLAALHAD